MPWYTTTLNKLPTNDFPYLLKQGRRLMNALEYIHAHGFVHMDIKGMNVFVASNGNCFLGDFGSCKPIAELVTSTTFQFYFEDVTSKPADVKYDWFMFMLMILIESLEDRREYPNLFYDNTESRFADRTRVLQFANSLTKDATIGEFIQELILKP